MQLNGIHCSKPIAIIYDKDSIKMNEKWLHISMIVEIKVFGITISVISSSVLWPILIGQWHKLKFSQNSSWCHAFDLIPQKPYSILDFIWNVCAVCFNILFASWLKHILYWIQAPRSCTESSIESILMVDLILNLMVYGAKINRS